MMSTFSKKGFLFTSLLAAASLLFTACEKAVNEAPAVQLAEQPFFVLTSDMALQTYTASNLSSPIKSVQVTGFQSDELALGIDFRPATGQLYALGNSSRIYTINTNTGVATPIGAAPFRPVLTRMLVGFNFEPTTDRIRIITNSGLNLRVNPETGAVEGQDGPVYGGGGAFISSISAAAYTNSVAGAARTVLYDVDPVNRKLYIQDPPNVGTLREVGNLTFSTFSGEASFDIGTDSTALLVATNVSGSTGISTLLQVDLHTAATTSLGSFSTRPGTRIIGLAIPTQPVAYAIDEMSNLVILNPVTNEQVNKPITGLLSGERINGIDFRPANGQLYALGSASNIYTINLSSGVAVQAGTMQLSPTLTGTSFGFDFNPAVDRIRVVSNLGQNLRLDPTTGLVAATDGTLNPGTPAVSAAAYTNNFAGATTTTLYVIDHTTDRLYIQNPPNNGTLVEVGPLGVNAEAGNGFDIGGTSGTAYAILTVGSSTRLYTINLATGAATAGIDIGKPVKGFAVGLGF